MSSMLFYCFNNKNLAAVVFVCQALKLFRFANEKYRPFLATIGIAQKTNGDAELV